MNSKDDIKKCGAYKIDESRTECYTVLMISHFNIKCALNVLMISHCFIIIKYVLFQILL